MDKESLSLLSELSAAELKPPKYYPIKYALMWVAYGNRPINLDYAKIIYDGQLMSIFDDTLKNAKKKLLAYLRSGKISAQSMEYKQDDDGNYIATGKFLRVGKDMWSDFFNWNTLTLPYEDETGLSFEMTDIQVKTDDLLKCLPVAGYAAKSDSKKLSEKLKPVPKLDKPIGVKEKDTLLKMIIGMAVKGYAYDPKAKKSSSIKEISDDLASLGIPLDADTVRKWIKEAAEILPRDKS